MNEDFWRKFFVNDFYLGFQEDKFKGDEMHIYNAINRAFVDTQGKSNEERIPCLTDQVVAKINVKYHQRSISAVEKREV